MESKCKTKIISDMNVDILWAKPVGGGGFPTLNSRLLSQVVSGVFRCVPHDFRCLNEAQRIQEGAAG